MKKYFRIIAVAIILFSFTVPFVFAAIQEAKERSQIPDKYKWDLSLMYKTDADWEVDFAKCEKLIPNIKKYKGKLSKNAKTLLSALRLADKISAINDRIYTYAAMLFCEDSGNNSYRGLLSRAKNLNSKTYTALSFIKPEIVFLSQSKINSFLKQEKGLTIYKFYLEKLRRLKPHTLSAKEEEILMSTADLSDSIRNIHTILKNTGIKFPKISDENGKEVQLSNSTFDSALKNSDRGVRKNFYNAFYKTYDDYIVVFASILNTKLEGDWFCAKNKKYLSALECSLNEQNVPVSIYDNLIKSVNANLKPLHRYYALRKKISGLKDYAVYDNYYPLTKASDSEVTYEKAREIINNALTPLGEDCLKVVNKSFTERWIDVYENKGKISGGYLFGSYGYNPYILLNFDNTLSGMSILAHELGHCMHFYLYCSNQPFIYAYSEFLSELPAILNEHLVANYLIENCNNKKEKLHLILEYLKNVMVRRLYERTMYAEFEKTIHSRIEAGKAPTKDDLNTLYFDLCKKYYGPEVIVDNINAYEWAKLQYLMMNYYAYQYATNLMASTCLLEKINREGKPALNKYLTLLKSGSSDYPISLLKKTGVDMTKPEVIMPTIRLFEKLLNEAEALVNEGVK